MILLEGMKVENFDMIKKILIQMINKNLFRVAESPLNSTVRSPVKLILIKK